MSGSDPRRSFICRRLDLNDRKRERFSRFLWSRHVTPRIKSHPEVQSSEMWVCKIVNSCGEKDFPTEEFDL